MAWLDDRGREAVGIGRRAETSRQGKTWWESHWEEEGDSYIYARYSGVIKAFAFVIVGNMGYGGMNVWRYMCDSVKAKVEEYGES